MDKSEGLEFLNRDGNLRVPCSRYGFDTESCAPVAWALAEVVAEATGEAIDSLSLDHAMGLVVNDHDDVLSVIREHGNYSQRALVSDVEPADLDADAYQLGADAARAAASWTFDGNSDIDERRRVLEMMRAGDPAAFDYLPDTPNLSGEMADERTPNSLVHELGEDPADLTPETIDGLCDAYENGVSETFEQACEAELVKFCRTLADLAGEAYGYFETRTRADTDERFDALKDDRPEWVLDLVRDAHHGVPDMLMLPDDWRYSAIRSALGFIHDNDAGEDDDGHEFADAHVDVYTGERYAWLASNLTREGYVQEARDEGLIGPDADIAEQIGVGQYMEAREVFGLVLDSLTARLNDDE